MHLIKIHLKTILMIALLTLNIPDGILYTSFGCMLTITITIVWSIIKLWFNHHNERTKLKNHIMECDKDREEAKEYREKDQKAFTELTSVVSRLNGNFEMLLKKISL